MPTLSGNAKGLGGFSILQRPRRYILLSSSLHMSVKKNMEKRVTPQQRIAVERMWRLFELAKKEWKKNPKRSRRYIELIRSFSTRFRIAIPIEIKNSFCKTCGNLWKEGENVKRRIKGNTLNSNCLICNTLTRRKLS